MIPWKLSQKDVLKKPFMTSKSIFFGCASLCSKLGHANTSAEVAVRNCNELNWFYAEEFFAEFFIDAALEQKK